MLILKLDLFFTILYAVQYMNNEDFYKSLEHFIRQLPGLSGWKTVEFRHGLFSAEMHKVLGYKQTDNLIGLTDYEVKNDAVVRHAEMFRNADCFALEHGEVESFYLIDYTPGEYTLVHSHKRQLRDYSGNVVGLLCFGNTAVDKILKNIFIWLSKFDSDLISDPVKSSHYFLKDGFSRSSISISNREDDCLFYLLRGMSSKSIAQILDISPRTVDSYIEKLKAKFNCNTRAELIDQCIGQGLLTTIPKHLINSLKKAGKQIFE